VRTEHDASADLAALESYAWARPPLKDTGRTIGPDLVGLDKLIRANVKGELAAKGMKEVPADEAQFFVEYAVGTEGQVDSRATHGGTMAGSRGLPGDSLGAGEGQYTRAYSEGMLTLTFTHPETGRMLWQGWANTVIADTDARPAKVQKAIRRLVKKFPPKR
jgi:hypothetical protein